MRRRISHQSSGMALVLVLGAILLLTVLVVAFLASTKTERTAARSQLNQTEARLLSENVLSLVTAQIREATTGTNAWISQPGAIRTFTGSQQPGQVYKLYSASQMVVPGADFNPASLADVPTGGGELNGNLFTDLNAPVKANGTWHYPILDPAALNVVEGFTETSGSSGIAKNTIQEAPAQIPMPVRWLYVLKDGQLQAMDDTGKVTLASDINPIVGRIAFWADDETCKLNINTASSGMYWDQPIGKGNQFERGAFAAGAANSMPVVTKTGLASSPPAVREFQRYPGHPAMTSLDVVFNNNTFFSPSLTAADRSKKILELAPRTSWGGSELGTKFPVTTAADGIVTLDKDRLYATVDELFYKQPGTGDTTRTGMATAGTGTPATSAMSLTPANLSLANFFLTANSRAPEVTAFNTPRVAIWPVDSTATNRTVFDKTIAFCSTVGGREYIFQRSAFDPLSISLVANSSFTGASNTGSQSATLDFTANNSTIYSYLKGLMAKPYPGFGASLASKFGADKDQILTEIYDYIRSSNLFDCSDANAKPYTGRFFYWNEANRLVGAGNTSGSLKSLPLPRDPAFWNLPLAYYVASAYGGQVVPAKIGSTRGFGRFPTIVGATLGFFATDTSPGKTPADFATMTYQPFPSPYSLSRSGLANWTANNTQPAGQIRGILLFSVANPAAGSLTIMHTYDVRVNSGLSSFKVNGASANMTDGSINRVLSLPHRSVEGSGVGLWDNQLFGGANMNPSNRTYNFGQRGNITPTGANSSSYPFVSQSNIAVSGSTLNFTGGTLDIDILVDGQVVQNVKMKFDDFTAPMPLWAPVSLSPSSPYRLIDCRLVAVSGASATVTTNWHNRLGLGAGGENSPMRYIVPPPVNLGINLAMCLMPNNLDTVRGIELNASAAPYGDTRLVAGLQNVPASYFQKCAGYDDSARNQAHSLWGLPQATNGNLVAGVSSASGTAAQIVFGLPSTMTAATRSDGAPGDWDAGVARVDVYGAGFPEAGAFINKPSDAAASFRDGYGNTALPYFSVNAMIASLDNPFTPNRMMPSAGMFGSLPVGVKRGMPWQTLLFRPNSPAHPGALNPPDHLILDLFQMPVVEPYAISEPFSTAGKVNLNWQIAPFSYIKRSTALRGVLYPEKITAVPTSNAFLFTLNPDGITGVGSSDGNNNVYNYRYNIDRNATMTLFEKRFTDNTPFLTASQICEMPLVPKPENVSASGLVPASKNPFQTALSANATASQVQTYVDGFWANTSLGGAGTADNLRERPYTTIYPRVTTKSNTFTVHLRVQSLKKIRGSDPQTFDQTKDTVTSQYRGSFIIERFLDPNASTFDITDSTSALGPYKFRVVNTKQFNP
jgi:uncharacterized protein (TIGR02600 family)